MIPFEKFTLENGLKVIFHQDKTTPIVAVNILYNVGARDEDPELTGFAHLFEHLMFGGSKNIERYDEVLEKIGAENNAFTNNDITNYYVTVPKENLESVFWLESDRMLDLAFSPKSLEVQRSVVIEEYKQRYLNQPYGDLWLLLRPLVYKKHPYQWATIGKDIKHIENAKMEDVKAFYGKYYNPNNAILSLVGDLELEEVKALCEKWFEPIPSGPQVKRDLPQEEAMQEPRFMEVERDVPVDAIYKVFPMCDRLHADYHATDLISDVLSNGKSGRFFQRLHKEQKLFSNISAFISGDIDRGMFIIAGHLNPGVDYASAESAIQKELDLIGAGDVDAYELQKVKNKAESAFIASEVNGLDKAMNLAYYELLGDANAVNEEVKKYNAVELSHLQSVAKSLFLKENSISLHYKKISNTPIDA